MGHVALYRKYRSQTFGDLMGQEHVVRTIQNGIVSGKIAHAYLFTGPRGTGKTSTARLVAKALNCENGPTSEPCNTCDSCLSITSGSSMDVQEMDAASESGVDDVRDNIVQATEYVPAHSRYRIFIIDEVHDLSPKAFDALLKTIEEPPAHVIFVLATTEYSKVPATIRSRCQKYEFHRATLSDLVGRLNYVIESEGMTADANAVHMIARMADGGYRDALSLLEQLLLTCDGNLTLPHVYDQLGLIEDETIDRVLLGLAVADPAAIIGGLDTIYQKGRDPRAVLEAMLTRVGDLTRALFGVESSSATDAAIEAGLRETASKIGPDKLGRIRQEIAHAHKFVKDVTLPRQWLEAILLSAALAPAAVAAPAPVAQKAVTPTPAPTPKPAAAEPAPVVEKPKPAPSANPAEASWQQVVATLSAASNLARIKLEKTQIGAVNDTEIEVLFERMSDFDWVNEKVKVLAAIQTEWKQTPMAERKLKLGVATTPT